MNKVAKAVRKEVKTPKFEYVESKRLFVRQHALPHMRGDKRGNFIGIGAFCTAAQPRTGMSRLANKCQIVI